MAGHTRLRTLLPAVLAIASTAARPPDEMRPTPARAEHDARERRGPVTADSDVYIEAGLADRVEHELRGPRQVEVNARGGVVIFRGWVSTLGDRRRLVELGRATRGVRAVVTAVALRIPEREDDTLRSDVGRALTREPILPPRAVDVAVRRGTVQLDGVVASAEQALAAERAAESVEGVRHVDDRLAVLTDPQPSDDALAAEIRHTLASDFALDVVVKDGRAALWGKVGSDAERSRAIDRARVAGVREVDATHLTVDEGLAEPWRRPGPWNEPSDETLAAAIRAALELEPRPTGDVTIAVDHGVATLSGPVADEDLELTVVALALATDGVRDVDDRLHALAPSPGARFDRELERAAREHVIAKTSYPTRVRVVQRVALVDGAPRSRWAELDLEQALMRLPGIEGVILRFS
jgi:osmotically-inducible protein OsmY